MNKLGWKIKELREAKGLTQGQLALKAKLKRPYISLVELGTIRKPSAERLLKIARALGVQPELLYTVAGYETPTKVYDLPAARWQYVIRETRKLSPEQQQYLVDMFERMINHEHEPLLEEEPYREWAASTQDRNHEATEAEERQIFGTVDEALDEHEQSQKE